MIDPNLSTISTLSPVEIAQYWFKYWNEVYPVEGLTLEISEKDIGLAARAHVDEAKTVFNKNSILLNYTSFRTTALHEQVHHLLKVNGYDFRHTLQFCLINMAIEYRFCQMFRTKSSPDMQMRIYDFHEDVAAHGKVNVRSMKVLAKKLSRYSDDIKTLLKKSFEYSVAVRNQIFNQENLVDPQIIYEQWLESDQKFQSSFNRERLKWALGIGVMLGINIVLAIK